MNDFGEVVVVAPDGPQSGKSHAITIEDTIRCDKVKIDDGPQEEYSCSGTPVDCVKIALNKLLTRKPDLCVSGINHGSNSSINVIYSGTMPAALESALEGIPSIGFSLFDYSHDADFSASKRVVKTIVKKVLKEGLPKGRCLNVNIPYVKEETKNGTRLNQIMRHTLGLFHGQTGSNFWKRYLSENLCVRDADVKKIDHIMDKVKLAPQAHAVGQIE